LADILSEGHFSIMLSPCHVLTLGRTADARIARNFIFVSGALALNSPSLPAQPNRTQISAAHTRSDLAYVVEKFTHVKGELDV